MNQQIINSLRRMRRLLAKKGKWTKHAVARNKAGCALMSVSNKSAYSFCLTGAMTKTGGVAVFPFLTEVTKLYLDMSVIQFNDSPRTKHGDILWLLDTTIEMAKDCK